VKKRDSDELDEPLSPSARKRRRKSEGDSSSAKYGDLDAVGEIDESIDSHIHDSPPDPQPVPVSAPGPSGRQGVAGSSAGSGATHHHPVAQAYITHPAPLPPMSDVDIRQVSSARRIPPPSVSHGFKSFQDRMSRYQYPPTAQAPAYYPD